MKTLTGNYPIGFRMRGWTRNASLTDVIAWTVESGLGALDIGSVGADGAKQVIEAGLRVGSIDLLNVKGMLSADAGKRAEAVAQNSDYVRSCAANGPLNHFLALVPEDPALPRAENFGYLVESFSQLAPVLEESDARIVIEGWPGPGALCCTPEGCRALFKEIPSKAMGLNYDPSHLIRMGVDHLRFLNEFVDRVYHVHGKDAEILPDKLYEFGLEQPATFAKAVPFGAYAWRYTIPGQGMAHWREIFRVLQANGYQGCVSIELEDANFNDGGDEEKAGILHGARFLTGC